MNWFCKWLWHKWTVLFQTDSYTMYTKCSRCGRYEFSYHPSNTDPLYIEWKETPQSEVFIAYTTWAIRREEYLKQCVAESKAAEERGRQWLISKQQS